MNKKFVLKVKYQGQRDNWQKHENAAFWIDYDENSWTSKEEALNFLERYIYTNYDEDKILDWQVLEVCHSELVVAKKDFK